MRIHKPPVALLALALLAMGAQLLHAQGPAVLIKGNTCALPDALGNSFTTTQTVTVFANDKNGNSVIQCHATQPAAVALPSRAVRWNYANTGMLCSTTFGLTQDWKAVVAPSGRVMLVCHINPNPTP